MDESNKNIISPDPQPRHRTGIQRSGRVMGGLFIVGIGILLLARQSGVHFPGWLFSFESILIALGIYLGLRHSFRGFAWAIPLGIGAILIVDDIYPAYDFHDFIWPLIIIGVGLFIIFRGTRQNRAWQYKRDDDPGDAVGNADEILDSTVVFGGVKKKIITKNFRGGEAVTVFGGTEINLMQADLTKPVVLELTQVFGGTKLIVPSHWKVHSSDLVAIMGGIDDKRPALGDPTPDENKVLILQGTCIFGGIDIRSF